MRYLQTASIILKKIYTGYLSHIPGLTNCVIPSKSYLIDRLVCPPAFHKVFIPPLQQLCTRDRTLEQRKRVSWVRPVLYFMELNLHLQLFHLHTIMNRDFPTIQSTLPFLFCLTRYSSPRIYAVVPPMYS